MTSFGDHPVQAFLTVLTGPHRGLRIQLPLTHFLIGRDKSCHLRPASPSISRFHCALAPNAGAFMVRDLKSANGTLVNGKRIEGTQRLKDCDRLQVGPLGFRFDGSLSDDEGSSGVLALFDASDFDGSADTCLDSGIETIDMTEIVGRMLDSLPEDESAEASQAAVDDDLPDVHLIGGESLKAYLRRRRGYRFGGESR